jgi:glycogen operon protein
MDDRRAERGSSAPLGAAVTGGGVNFSVFSKHATSIELLLFDDANSVRPSKVLPLHPDRNRTYHYWHIFVPGLLPGQVYAYRAHGPRAPERGLRFDGEKVLLDPYGLAVAVPETYSRRNAGGPGDNAASAMKSVVADPGRYDWEGDVPLRRPFAETIIYEIHVGGFTRHPGSGVPPEKRGTYAGLIEKIPYLQDLGVTAVELLPVFQFDPQDAPDGRVNYWGYQPVSFFAPHHAYSSRKPPPARSTSSATWSRRFTAPGSRSSSTWSSTTPRRAAGTARRSATAASPTTTTTSSGTTGRNTPTTPGAATR